MPQERGGDRSLHLPSSITLPALGEEWQVEYRPTSSGRVTARSHTGSSLIMLHGAVGQEEACRQALLRWLRRRGQAALGERLRHMAATEGLTYERLTVRYQRSRWGSYSRRGTISLNARLLFLPPDLVDYVLLHELCHTLEFNHSPRFWKAVTIRMPEAVYHRVRLRRAHEHLPTWLDRGAVSALP